MYFDLQKLEILQMYNVPTVLVAGGVLKFPVTRKYSIDIYMQKHIASTYMYTEGTTLKRLAYMYVTVYIIPSRTEITVIVV